MSSPSSADGPPVAEAKAKQVKPKKQAKQAKPKKQAKQAKQQAKQPRPRRSSARSKAASSASETSHKQSAPELSAIRKTAEAPRKDLQDEPVALRTKDVPTEEDPAKHDKETVPDEAAAEDKDKGVVATTATASSSNKRGRKRRKTGVVAVAPRTLPLAAGRSIAAADEGIASPGTSNRANTDTNTTTVLALESTRRSAAPLDIHQADPSTTTISGQPRLKQYCSKFRTPRQPRGTKRRKTTTHAAAATPATAEANTGGATAAAPAPAASTRVAAGPVVQIVNGEIVLQESSMVVTGTGVGARSGAHPLDEEDVPVVEEEAQLGGIGSTYSSFAQRQAPQQWSAAETRKFYDALRQVGTDFGTMEMLFSSKRTRKMLKTKFRNEQAKQPLLIEAALHPKARNKIDLQVFDVVVDEVAIKEARKIRDAEFAKITKARAEKEAAEEAAAEEAREEASRQEAEATLAMVEEVVEDADAPAMAAGTPSVKNRAFGLANTAATADSFWKETTTTSTRKDPTDPNWPDEGDINEEEEGTPGTAAAISLVSNKTTKKKPTSRPRFLSRKRKGKS